LYEELKEHYDYGIAIHASKMLTGTYESSKVASKQTGFSVEVIDSKMGNYALGKMIKYGLEMKAQGKTYEDIVTKLKSFSDEAEMFLLPESLEQMKRSERVSAPKAMFASLLNINIILGFENGKVVVKDRVRTKKRAERRLFTIITE